MLHRPSASRSPYRYIRSGSLTVLILSTLLSRPVWAQEEPLVVFIPSQIAAGGQLNVSAYNLDPGAAYPLAVDGPEGIQILSPVMTGRTGAFGPVTLEATLSPGAHLLSVGGRSNAVTVAMPFTVFPAPTIFLNSTAGTPGTVVQATVTNLLTGTLRLDFAGHTVLGPMPVAAGPLQTSFVVPGGVPGLQPGTVAVSVHNFASTVLVGRGEITFQLQPAPNIGYTLRSLQTPAQLPARGQTFVLSGRIDPPPASPLNNFLLAPMWQTTNGLTFPIGAAPPTLKADGSFSILAKMPSLASGDPSPGQTGDKVGVTLALANGALAQSAIDAHVPPPGTVLNIKVVEKGTEGTSGEIGIKDAKIRVFPTYQEADISSLYESGSAILTGPPTQLDAALADNGEELTEEEKAQIDLAKIACKIIGVSLLGPDDLINPIIDPAMESLYAVPSLQNFMLKNSAPAQGPLGQSSHAASVAADHLIQYTVVVDAIAQGYGDVILEDGDFIPVTTYFYVTYNSTTGQYLNSHGDPVPNPVVVPLPKLPTEVLSPLGAIPLFFEGLPEDLLPGIGQTYGVYWSAANAPANTIVNASKNEIKVSVRLTPAEHKLVADQGMKLYLDNSLVGTFEFSFVTGIKCNMFKGTVATEAAAYVGKVKLQKPYALSPGKHPLRLEVKLANGGTYNYTDSTLQINDLPAWFKQSGFSSRTLNWSPSQVFLTGAKYDSKSDPKPLAQTVPKYGFVNNQAGLDLKLYQTLHSNGSLSAVNRTGNSRAVSWNTQMPAANLSAAGAKDAALESAAIINYKYSVPRVTTDLGKTTIFGIPYVADISVGLKLWYEASVAVNGEIKQTMLDQPPTVDLTIRPSATAGADFYGDVTILYDIIADVQVHTLPQITVDMPIRFTPTGVSDADICFKYRLDYSWTVSALCVPEVCAPVVGCTGGWCAYDKSGKGNIFEGHTPDSQMCEPWPDETVQAAAAPPALPMPKPVLATDGLGQVMVLWRSSQGSLLSSLYSGNDWSAPSVLVQGPAADAMPALAYYAPGKALAVWVASTITEEPDSPLTADQVLDNQYLAYALWNGQNWSPPQLLFPDQGGRNGAVALAGCLDPAKGCPVDGAVTAVWVHVAGGVSEHHYQLQYTSFSDGGWNAPQLVDDTDWVADNQPRVAYDQNGVPTAMWVRDADRNYNTAADRRLWSRRLDGASASEELTDLPNGIVTADLTVRSDGSRFVAFTVAGGENLLGPESDLHVAWETCDGSTCAWHVRLLRDLYGRSVRAERVVATLDGQERPTLTFRGVGFGPDAAGELMVLPTDPPGMTHLTGELAQIQFDPASANVAVHYLTQDGAVNWQPAAVYAPHLDSTLAVATNLPEFGPLQADISQAASFLVTDESLVFAVVTQLPDIAVGALAVDSVSAATLLTVTLENRGAILESDLLAETPLLVEAAWDGEPGVGTFAGQAVFTHLDTAGTQVRLTLTPPPDALARPHTLVVVVNRGKIHPEADGTNNRAMVDLGGLPVPTGLAASSQSGSRLVVLTWAPSLDARIAGYRVYRRQSDEGWVPAGSSPVAGFADLSVATGSFYQYSVTAFTAAGLESARSAVAEVETRSAAPILQQTLLPSLFR